LASWASRSVGRTRYQSFEHLPSRLAHDVRSDRGQRQLYVDLLWTLLQPIDLGRALLHQSRPVAREFPQRPLESVGHEAALQQTVPEQLGDPLAIRNVVLPTGDVS